MKIILTEDVYKHGVAGEVVSVADGYARNYLIPQGMAVKATPGSLKQHSKLRAEADKRRALRDQELREVAEKIEGLTLAFPVKAGETGKLYGSVTMAHVAEAIEEALGIGIDARRVGDRALRELGEHKVMVRLSGQLMPSATVLVHREDEPAESVRGMLPPEEMLEEEFVDYEEDEPDEGAEDGEDADTAGPADEADTAEPADE